ncbi:amino acid adenylation domain-containing protein [Streptomyces xinghaiensis]|uniref:amino acid adenylation domain-containing protein n=1 Tax=Streptomyces xinghaiensis TaxID=1038928 RepID=UPI002E12E05D|nr:amino acid adenylation domain-containing protein [Streptomyces xinghaiensis]
MNPFEDTGGRYLVLADAEGRHSLWPEPLPVPPGWRTVHGPGPYDSCVTHVEEHWTDQRPASLAAGRAGPAGSTGPMPAELLEEGAARDPGAAAVVYEDDTLTHRELHARADRLARRLAARGVGPESVVAVLLPRSAELVVAMVAVLKAGGAYLPVETGYPRERIAFLLRDARPALVLTPDHPVLRDEPGERGESGEQGEPAGGGPGDGPGPGPDRSGLLPDHPAYVVYTSGSTGTPKGIVMPCRGLANLLDWHRTAMPVRPGKRTAQFTAIGFDFSVQEILAALVAGQTVVIPPDEVRTDMDAMAEWCDRQRVNELFAPTSVLDALLAAARARGSDLPALTDVYQGGEALTVDGRIRAFAAGRPAGPLRVHNIYGPAETHAATAYTLDGDPTDWPAAAPLGPALTGARCYVLDERLRPADTGELYIAGAQLARGYLGRPGLTARRFVADPHGAPGERMYRSGDLVRRDAAGELVFAGRTDDQVKIRGFRVEPGETEAALLRHPGVGRAAVVARRDAGGHRLVGYVTRSGPDPVDPGALRAHAEALLPAHQVPAVLVELDDLPLTANGKLDRAALPDPGAPGEGEPAAPAGRTPTERALCALFGEVLGIPAPGPAEDFFRLGGHSLLAAELTERVRGRLGRRISVRAVYRTPTPTGLAGLLDTAAR